MSDRPTPEKNPAVPALTPTASVAPIPSSASPLSSTVDTPAEGADHPPATANALTPEEQMALFEKKLKENDWGHQPC